MYCVCVLPCRLYTGWFIMWATKKKKGKISGINPVLFLLVFLFLAFSSFSRDRYCTKKKGCFVNGWGNGVFWWMIFRVLCAFHLLLFLVRSPSWPVSEASSFTDATWFTIRSVALVRRLASHFENNNLTLMVITLGRTTTNPKRVDSSSSWRFSWYFSQRLISGRVAYLNQFEG